MKPRTNFKNVDNWQKQLQKATAEELLEWSAETFSGHVAFASSLGLEDQVLTDMIARLKIQIPVFTLDTGRLFPETYDLLQCTLDRYELEFRIYYPERKATENMVNRHGINLFRKSVELRKQCCHVRKIEPLRRALKPLKAWICGLRRSQSVTRADIKNIEWDEANGLVKLNPLINWMEDDVWRYIKAHKVPNNPLHERGFPSIGCACCTRAIQPGEDIRAGRWWWEAPEQKECGLHLQGGKLVRKKAAGGESR